MATGLERPLNPEREMIVTPTFLFFGLGNRDLEREAKAASQQPFEAALERASAMVVRVPGQYFLVQTARQRFALGRLVQVVIDQALELFGRGIGG